MGCASSGPVANTGKNFIDAAKETANDVAAKGEKTIQGEWGMKLIAVLRVQRYRQQLRLKSGEI